MANEGKAQGVQPTTARDINQAFRGGPRAIGFLSQINKASIVMLAEEGIVAADTAAAIAAGVVQLDGSLQQVPSADYLDYEKTLSGLVGEQASLIHAGRSRQDIGSTLARMNLRDDVLNAHGALAKARASLVKLAPAHRDTIIPAFTHGVQAQPTTFAHYLLAFSSAFGRQLQRLAEAYARINLCTLGAAALSTSSFHIDRARLAALLGFDGVLENAYDANHLAPVDSSLDFAGAIANCAIQAGMFAQDLHAQYASPRPWVTMQSGELLGVSSLMPQKRNPAALEQLRAQSSLLLAELQGPYLVAHNVRTGMFDYRSYDPLPSPRPVLVFELLDKVVGSLVVDKQQARAEVDADYSTVTEIADQLMQKAGVPFRIGHHFASDLVDHGRSQRKLASEITYAEAAQIYQDKNGSALPLDEKTYAMCMDPEQMVFNRKGLGGPQLAEVDRMLQQEARAAEHDLAWNGARRDALQQADEGLDRLLQDLVGA